MLRLDKVIKPWKESATLDDHINLYGFWNETFLRKAETSVSSSVFLAWIMKALTAPNRSMR